MGGNAGPMAGESRPARFIFKLPRHLGLPLSLSGSLAFCLCWLGLLERLGEHVLGVCPLFMPPLSSSSFVGWGKCIISYTRAIPKVSGIDISDNYFSQVKLTFFTDSYINLRGPSRPICQILADFQKFVHAPGNLKVALKMSQNLKLSLLYLVNCEIFRKL